MSRIRCTSFAPFFAAAFFAGVLFFVGDRALAAGDWPQWRYDAGRGAAAPHALAPRLHLQWVRQLPEPRPAWPASQPWLRFDASYSPVAAGKLLFVPSMVTDRLTAYDTETGAERWRFYTNGPVRLAPVVHGGKVYAGSDDGYLYCLDAATGRLLWNVRGGPSDRRILGNERLISTWPIRSGPVYFDGTLYFTSGIWPFMGIFIHAIDAETGKPRWINSGYAMTYTVQPHNSPAFASFVPRGHLAATKHGLIAPGGRTEPGRFDLETGRLLGFTFGVKGAGSYHVSARDAWFFVTGTMRNVSDGETVLATQAAIHDDQALYRLAHNEISARAIVGPSQPAGPPKHALRPLWSRTLSEAPGKLYLKAGATFYAGKEGQVAAIEVDPEKDAKNAPIVWRGSIEGSPWCMIAADGKLFVVTIEGAIYCFGKSETEPKRYLATKTKNPKTPPVANQPPAPTAPRPKAASPPREGYGLLFGADAGLAESLLADAPKLHLIAIDPDAEKIDAFRRRFDDTGLYGTRVAAHRGDPATFALPPYLAEAIWIADDRPANSAKLLSTAFRALRPYGGKAFWPTGSDALGHLVEQAQLEGAQVEAAGPNRSLLVREGPLPGAADWTHQYADAANTVVSADHRVKPPLGLLWFGGPPNNKVLPRHGHGPSPQVAGGRLLIEGPHMLRALDVYTGRLLWERELPDLGRFYDNTSHHPGAGEIGSNYVSLDDAVYVAYRDAILKLHPATGATEQEFKLEPAADEPSPTWGFLAAEENLLIATSTPVAVPGAEGKQKKPPVAAGWKPIVKPHSQWRYLAGEDPQDAWSTPEFDDHAWKSGPAGFGYGDRDDQTQLPMQGRFGRVYVRKRFDAATLGNAQNLALAINYDDAFIAYLNGKEVARAGIKTGNGPKASNIAAHEAQGFEIFPIGQFRAMLREGENVIAVEGHNVSLASSDFTLDPYLATKPAKDTQVVSPSIDKLDDLLTPTRYASASRRLVVLDRHTGRLRWERTARTGFRHNNIAVGGGKIFAIDGLSAAKRKALVRRGIDPATFAPRLVAFDLRTGLELWATTENVFGTFLNYSEEHDILLQAGSAFRDRASDEAKTGMVAHRGSDGRVLWKDLARPCAGPCLLHHDTIITQGPAYSLLTGKPKTTRHPLTGQPLPWQFTRNYGCNTAVGSEHLLTFRSAAAGYFDLATSGTGNLGGFKSSCTSNLISAGGLLSAPEYTRTCECRYQNQTSLALVHDPDVEAWAFHAMAFDGKPVRRVGINFGAPGDRTGPNGTLWLDNPSVGGPSPDLPIERELDREETFRHHSTRIRLEPESNALRWVAASGIRGEGKLRIRLAEAGSVGPRQCTVRLHFAEVDGVAPGKRVFHVDLQERRVVTALDPVAEAGPMTALVREFSEVSIAEVLEISLVRAGDAASAPPILCGVEIVETGHPLGK